MALMERNTVFCRRFYLIMDSAKNLPNVHKVSRTKAYAKVSIGSGSNKITYKTTVDKHNGLNPFWNHDMKFDIAEEDVLYDYDLTMVIKIYSCPAFGSDRYIGGVQIAMKHLYDVGVALNGGNAVLSLPIHGEKGIHGTLNLSYSFGKKFEVTRNHYRSKRMQVRIKNVVKVGFKYGVKIMIKGTLHTVIHLAAHAVAPGSGFFITAATFA